MTENQNKSDPPLKVDLRLHSNREDLPTGYKKGRSVLVRGVWMVVNAVLLGSSLIPGYRLKTAVLRLFGAEIGKNVVIKTGISVKYPWYLSIGDYTWIGERAWLDCTAPLRIGQHVVISQGVYVSCGGHDWQDPGMGTVAAPVTIEDGAWIAAYARVAGGVRIGQEAMIAMGSVVLRSCDMRSTYSGNPARRVGVRRIRDYPGPARVHQAGGLAADQS